RCSRAAILVRTTSCAWMMSMVGSATRPRKRVQSQDRTPTSATISFHDCANDLKSELHILQNLHNTLCSLAVPLIGASALLCIACQNCLRSGDDILAAIADNAICALLAGDRALGIVT